MGKPETASLLREKINDLNPRLPVSELSPVPGDESLALFLTAPRTIRKELAAPSAGDRAYRRVPGFPTLVRNPADADAIHPVSRSAAGSDGDEQGTRGQ